MLKIRFPIDENTWKRTLHNNFDISTLRCLYTLFDTKPSLTKISLWATSFSKRTEFSQSQVWSNCECFL